MKKIHKVALVIDGYQEFELPAFATILTVQVQHGIPCMWYEFDPDFTAKQKRNIRTCTTGNGKFESNTVYIGTYQMEDGNFVGHVYELL